MFGDKLNKMLGRRLGTTGNDWHSAATGFETTTGI
jgi:hypothetical protein